MNSGERRASEGMVEGKRSRPWCAACAPIHAQALERRADRHCAGRHYEPVGARLPFAVQLAMITGLATGLIA
jgi:hypothetical protein